MWLAAAFVICFATVTYCRFCWLILKSISTKDLVHRESHFSSAQPNQSSDISRVVGHWIIKVVTFILRHISVNVIACIPSCVVFLASLVWLMELKDATNSSFWDLACIQTVNSTRSDVWIFCLVGFVFALIGLVVLRVKDNFGIAFECIILVIVLIIFVVSWFLCTVLNVDETIQLRLGLYADLYFASFLTLFWGVRPCWIARKNQIAERNSERRPSFLKNNEVNLVANPPKATSNHQQLRTLIASPEDRKLFLSFLELEFSVENLYFVEACDALRQLDMGSENFLKHIELIQTTFVDSTAVSSVNLSYNARLRLLNEMTQVKHSGVFDFSVLEEARSEIFSLMVKDTFTRFKFTQPKR
eukprot:TRINITY_DN15995_c0_g1_i5.p1 TRINITY_DN15995_c0_g1~~TRINITY_DN15995_c0_g1_i5.p1  ORF type:complete len:376 (-),score=81.00 TRINITY_DN15995_c0_g1_i5:69-1145(-)